tara:strand:+ start:15 stop:1343 length:1329 start_codon:yes stop_codon:yes gene_type:complete
MKLVLKVLDAVLLLLLLPFVALIVSFERKWCGSRRGAKTTSLFLGNSTLGWKSDPVEVQATQALFCHAPISKTVFMTPSDGSRKPVFRVASNLVSVHFSCVPARVLSWSKVLTWLSGDFRFLILAARRSKALRPLFFEVNFGPEIAVWGIVFSYLTGLPLVVQVRGNAPLLEHLSQGEVSKRKSTLLWLVRWLWLSFISAWFYSRANLVLGYNRNNGESAISQGCAPSRLRHTRIRQFTVFEANSDDKGLVRESLGILPSDKIVLLWSRLEPGILIEPAFRAMIVVLMRADNVHFVVAGNGSLLPELECQAKEHGLIKRVHLLGYQHRSQIAAMCRDADVALLPYGGSTIIEAASQGLPVATFDVEWLGEVIEDGVTGYLADYIDENSMVVKLLEALSDPDEAKKRARALKLTTSRMFNLDRIENRESRVISQFISELRAHG